MATQDEQLSSDPQNLCKELGQRHIATTSSLGRQKGAALGLPEKPAQLNQ